MLLAATILLAQVPPSQPRLPLLQEYYKRVAAKGIYMQWQSNWGHPSPSKGWFVKGRIFTTQTESRGAAKPDITTSDGSTFKMISRAQTGYWPARSIFPIEPGVYPMYLIYKKTPVD